MAKRKPVQGELFAFENPVEAARANMRGFLSEETRGYRFPINCDKPWLLMIDMMLIAAESLAETRAQQYSGINPEDPSFCFDIVRGRLNQRDAYGAFVFDLDKVFDDEDRANNRVVSLLLEHADNIAEALVFEARYNAHNNPAAAV